MLRGHRNHRGSVWLWVACTLAIWLVCVSSAHAYAILTTERGAQVHWREPRVTLRIDGELEDYFHDLPMAEAVDQAAATWSALMGVPELLVERGCADGPGFEPGLRATNGVYLIRDWQLQANSLAVTVTTFETKTGRLVDSDILVNANFRFSWLVEEAGEGGRYDLLSVLTHELGHVLGLADARDEPDATMWPSILAGDTHQRDLAPDDEAGAASLYMAEEVIALTGGAGCGGASVLRPPSIGDGWRAGLGLLLLAVVLWLSARSSASSRRGPALLLGGALLFGGSVPAPAPQTPRAPDPARELASMPWLPRDHPDAQRRLSSFVDGADYLLQGRAQTRVERRAGLLWTRVRVDAASGGVELEVPGGSLDGVTQVFSGRAAPRDGEVLLIAFRKRGPHGWAHVRDGRLHGGSLGDGPALEWD